MSASLTYHRLTSYSPERPWHQPLDDERIVQGFAICAPGNRPAQFKTYPPGMPEIPLTDSCPSGPVRGGWSADHLSRLLFHSAGVLRYRDTEAGRVYYRAAGSAGNRHPLESYVVTPSGMLGIPPGVWHFDPLRHLLRRVGTAPATGPSYVVLTGVPWRSSWRYAERAWRHLWWDCGTVVAHMLALAPEARLRLNFPDGAVATIVGADGKHEHPLAVLALEDGEPSYVSGGLSATGYLDADPPAFPLVDSVHEATRRAGPGWEPAGDGGDLGIPAIEEVIRRRGSTRKFDPAGAQTAAGLRRMMAIATHPIAWDAGPGILRHHVVMHEVSGFEPGGYEWRDGSFEQHTRAESYHREATHRFCLEADLARDAGFLVVHCADLPSTVERLGERGYRAANLEAGIVAGRLHLAAYATGHGATGMVFNDDLAPAFLRADTTALLATAVGTVAYRSVAGGRPRDPARLLSRGASA